ncbi:hypothetical protein J7U46_20650 [Pelomonas sp. V22]|uniref:hypothetical protein n=1 Tax=Pelomonas sp. V22 TaxID=2822139 RepID=UPI0024A9DD07|nr:hypothetical protein [Pelomonas sp. V22]MDI4635486.1 hypothetical protein [Pelomonas sp. V22]
MRVPGFASLTATALVARGATSVSAQNAARGGALFHELARMETELFDAAFVACSADRFRAVFTEDAEPEEAKFVHLWKHEGGCGVSPES